MLLKVVHQEYGEVEYDYIECDYFEVGRRSRTSDGRAIVITFRDKTKFITLRHEKDYTIYVIENGKPADTISFKGSSVICDPISPKSRNQ